MTEITKQLLSGSTDGEGISITATSSGGTTIHTAVTGGGPDYDEVWIYAQNNHTADVVLNIEFAGTTAKDNIIKTVTSKAGLVCIVPGFPLKNGAVIKAYAATTAVITIHGFVNRITVT